MTAIGNEWVGEAAVRESNTENEWRRNMNGMDAFFLGPG
jgi:hypothetical protein